MCACAAWGGEIPGKYTLRDEVRMISVSLGAPCRTGAQRTPLQSSDREGADRYLGVFFRQGLFKQEPSEAT